MPARAERPGLAASLAIALVVSAGGVQAQIATAPPPAAGAPDAAVASSRPLRSCTPGDADTTALLAQTPTIFDQSERGWRTYAAARCFSAAAALIAAYRQARAELSPDRELLLRFHEAQMLAYANRSDDAIGELNRILALEPLRPSPDPGWRFYVQGLVAFLRQDRATLDQAASDLDGWAQAESGQVKAGDQLNLNALHGLQRCFGRSYDFAFNGPDCRDLDEVRRLNRAIDPAP